MAKMGRPKSDDPRNIRFSIRLNEQENKELEEICEITGENKNEVIRRSVERYYKYLKKKN